MFRNLEDEKSLEDLLHKVYYAFIYCFLLVWAVIEWSIKAPDIIALSMDKEAEYIFSSVAIISMILGIPLSLKLHKFDFFMKKFIVEDISEAYKSYFSMSMWRYSILCFTAIINIVTYCIYDNNSNLICLIILGIAYFFAIPTDIQIKNEMNRTPIDNEQTNNEVK